MHVSLRPAAAGLASGTLLSSGLTVGKGGGFPLQCEEKEMLPKDPVEGGKAAQITDSHSSDLFVNDQAQVQKSSNPRVLLISEFSPCNKYGAEFFHEVLPLGAAHSATLTGLLVAPEPLPTFPAWFSE